MLERGQGVFHVLAVGLIAVVLVTLRRLPLSVASHFDAAGTPNGWSSRLGYALLLVVIGVFLPLSIAALVRGLTRRDPALLNIPAWDYWTRPEHGKEAVRRVRAYVWWLGCIMAGTALMIHLLVLDAHEQQPPRLSTGALLLVLGAAFSAVAGWAVGWYRLLQRPQSTKSPARSAPK
jgi:Protein of unknown function (DUF1648)